VAGPRYSGRITECRGSLERCLLASAYSSDGNVGILQSQRAPRCLMSYKKRPFLSVISYAGRRDGGGDVAPAVVHSYTAFTSLQATVGGCCDTKRGPRKLVVIGTRKDTYGIFYKLNSLGLQSAVDMQ